MSEQRTVDGRYRLDKPVGSGGMGVVWRAFDLRLGRVVAVKEVRFPSAMSDEERAALTKRAMLEAQSAGRLDHPNIVPVHDVILEDDQPFIIMRFVEGRSLDQTVSADGPLPDRVVARIGVQLLDALGAAHAADVIHRDVKPHNVLIQPDGTAQLTDFSIASVFGTETLTKTGALLGSPGYIAPERLMTGATTPGGDLFALGATLFFAAEGIGPFTAKETIVGLFASATRPHPRPKHAGPRLTQVIDGLLEKNPDDRLERAQARALLSNIVQTPEESETRSGEFVPPPPGRVDTDDNLPSDDSTAVLAVERLRGHDSGDLARPVSGGTVYGRPVSGAPVSGAPGSGAPVSGGVVYGRPISGAPVSGGVVYGRPISGARELAWGPGAVAGGPPPESPPSFTPGPSSSPPAGRRWKRALAVLTIIVLGLGAGIIANLVATADRTEKATTVGQDTIDDPGSDDDEPTPYDTPRSPTARTTGAEPSPSRTRPDPSPSTTGPSQTSKPPVPDPAKVTSVTLTVSQPTNPVDCTVPLTVTVTIGVKTTGTGNVSWELSREGVLIGNDTKPVTEKNPDLSAVRSDTISKPATGTYSYTLVVQSPSVESAGPKSFDVTCAPGDVTASP